MSTTVAGETGSSLQYKQRRCLIAACSSCSCKQEVSQPKGPACVTTCPMCGSFAVYIEHTEIVPVVTAPRLVPPVLPAPRQPVLADRPTLRVVA